MPPSGYLRIGVDRITSMGWKAEGVWVLELEGVFMHFQFQEKPGEKIGQYVPINGAHHWLRLLGYDSATGFGRV